MLNNDEDVKGGYNRIRGVWLDLHTKAEVEYQQIIDMIELAHKGSGAFPTPDEVEESNQARYKAQEAMEDLVDFIQENNVTPEMAALFNDDMKRSD